MKRIAFALLAVSLGGALAFGQDAPAPAPAPWLSHWGLGCPDFRDRQPGQQRLLGWSGNLVGNHPANCRPEHFGHLRLRRFSITPDADNGTPLV